jgi:hypothetical protein
LRISLTRFLGRAEGRIGTDGRSPMLGGKSGLDGCSSDGMQLLWAPPSFGDFDPEAVGLFRFFLDDEGFVRGLLMHQEATDSQPGVTRLSWSCQASVSDPLWQMLTTFAGAGMDAKLAFQLLQHEGSVTWGDVFTSPARGARLTIRQVDVAREWMQGMTDDTSAWAGDAPVPPRRLGVRSSKAVWNPITDDGSLLLIDSTTGLVLTAEETAIAPCPVGEAYDPFFAHSADMHRMSFAYEYGGLLGMPGSDGIPLGQIDDEDRAYVLIDRCNGNATTQVVDVALVPTPDDLELYEALVDDPELATGYAIQHGEVPVAPFEIRELGHGAYELG